ncbi:MAG: hypothetical protein KME17_15520 [Cyanosarcina radialis HA8281-LM2]|jgi:hypothetical protein|nr:hypothetical protein [Cyanosarcina radialis HA8281-LM2]
MNLVVKFNETVSFEEGKLTLYFQEVLEDSRCPVGTECFWEGNAKILLSVSQGDKEPVEVTLNTSGKAGMSQAAVAFEYLIKLDRLGPYPTAIGKPNLEDYVATLAVTKMALVAH